MTAGTLIVGGGLAGQRAAEALRRRGYEETIRIVCGEPEPPYDRPPLSKEVLAGTAAEEEVAYRPAGWYAENEVELSLGVRAEALDPARRRVTLSSGDALPYENLVIATGGEPRRLPFLAGANVHELRTLADLRRLRRDLVAGSRLAIVGAGFIGQEVAATARALGAEVTIVEALPVPLEPIVGPQLGRWFAELHQEEGVRIIAGAALQSARGGGGRVEELVLADGRSVACDAVLVGIGTVPATGWLQGSGLGSGGVPVDVAGRTALPGVFAAGDACLGFEPRRRAHLRTEHWDAAAWQGAAVAKAILGEEPGDRRCRASGAISTESASSASATRSLPMTSPSRATRPTATSKRSSAAAASPSPDSLSAAPARSRPFASRSRGPAWPCNPRRRQHESQSNRRPRRVQRPRRLRRYRPHGLPARRHRRRDRHRHPGADDRGGRGLPRGGDLDRRRVHRRDRLPLSLSCPTGPGGYCTLQRNQERREHE